MANGPTLSTDLQIPPAVWADMIAAEFPVKVKFAPLATVNTELQGKPGDKIFMPWWKPLTDAVEVAETDVLVPEKLTHGDEEMTIKEAGKAVEITDKAKLTAYGNPVGEARRQIVQTVTNKIDTDCYATLTAAGAETVAQSASPPAGESALVNALPDAIGKFGDLDEGDWADTFTGLAISPGAQIDVMRDKRFLTRDLAGTDATLFRGAIGSLYGIPLIVSSRVTGTTKGVLVRRGALLLAYKRQPLVETDRDILARSDVITANVHYGTYRLTRRKGVCLITGTA